MFDIMSMYIAISKELGGSSVCVCERESSKRIWRWLCDTRLYA